MGSAEPLPISLLLLELVNIPQLEVNVQQGYSITFSLDSMFLVPGPGAKNIEMEMVASHR